jgi:hypothetical protein
VEELPGVGAVQRRQLLRVLLHQVRQLVHDPATLLVHVVASIFFLGPDKLLLFRFEYTSLHLVLDPVEFVFEMAGSKSN